MIWPYDPQSTITNHHPLRYGGVPVATRPPRLGSRWAQWRRERACRRATHHCWHPADPMIAWFCCMCSADTDGMPRQLCALCAPQTTAFIDEYVRRASHYAGAQVISTRMADGYDPPSAALRPTGQSRDETGQLDDISDEVGAGWHPLIAQLHTDLLTLDPDYRVTQVKEKYGALRVHLNSGTAEMWDLIDAASAASLTICETCGHAGSPARIGGWIYTRCGDPGC